MTLREMYRWGMERLSSAGIEEASLDAWYLMEYVTGISRAAFLADSQREMPENEKKWYREVVSRREKRIPLQHITGTQEFMGLEFCVNEHVLIPRQDTEVLVEAALEELKRLRESVCHTEKRTELLDMCTGSGCILLSTLHYARKEYEENPLWITGIGVDISKEALRVAQQNAEKLSTDVKWVESNLFEKVEGRFDMILSNPPYIPSDVIETLQPEVREHDPRLALDGKEDGLYFYRKMIEESKAYLNPGGVLMFEIGSDQGAAVSSYMKACGYTRVGVKKDLAGLDRVVSGVYDSCALQNNRTENTDNLIDG